MGLKDELLNEPSLKWILAVVALCLLALPFAMKYEANRRIVTTTYAAPDFSAMDLKGKTFGLADLKGKVWLADFVLIRCSGQCPMVTKAMTGFQKKWKAKGLRMVSFTLDSEGYPKELKQYAKSAEDDPACWTFLTGKGKDMSDLCQKGFRLPDAVEAGSAFIHSSQIALVDREGRIRGYYDGMKPEEMKALDEAIAGLLADKT